jgi:TRAP-type C4-dicarboxylate transport system permease small subunit
MIWMVFLGVGLGIRENAHVGMTMFLNRLSPRNQQRMEIVIHFLIIYFLIYCLKYGIDLTIMSAIQLTPIVKIPMYCLYMAVPIGAGLMILQSISKIIGVFNPALAEEEKRVIIHNL